MAAPRNNLAAFKGRFGAAPPAGIQRSASASASTKTFAPTTRTVSAPATAPVSRKRNAAAAELDAPVPLPKAKERKPSIVEADDSGYFNAPQEFPDPGDEFDEANASMDLDDAEAEEAQRDMEQAEQARKENVAPPNSPPKRQVPVSSAESGSKSAAQLQVELDQSKKVLQKFKDSLIELIMNNTTFTEDGFDVEFVKASIARYTAKIEDLTAQISGSASGKNSAVKPAPMQQVQQSKQASFRPVVSRAISNTAEGSDDYRGQSPLAGHRPPLALQPSSGSVNLNRLPSSSSTVAKPTPVSRAQSAPNPPVASTSRLPPAPTQSDLAASIFPEEDAPPAYEIVAPPVRKSNMRPAQATGNKAAPLTIDDSETEDDDDQPICNRARSAVKAPAQPAPAASSSKGKGRAIEPPSRPVVKTAAVPYNENAHPWSKDVRKFLYQVFRLKNFRANQLEAIDTTLSGKDCFVLMPTGGGKSLCYQLPAVIQSGKTSGITLVVSPLLSLIQDQVSSLMGKGVIACPFNGTMAKQDRDYVLREMKKPDPTLALVYVTPELLAQSAVFNSVMKELYARGKLARFVIDEAHCMSSWGHDFRPDYKQLGKLKTEFPKTPIIALTATANERVKQDVLANLGIKGCRVLTQSFNRANLAYEIRIKKKGVLDDISTFIKEEHSGECGIIYCLSKAQCENTAQALRDKYQIRAHHYHAGMNKGDRTRTQTEWQSGKIHVICATIAFGMGIDQAAVRYVIHYSLPSSLEGYYQETGRAGRDGKQSVCILYYAYGDTHLIQRLIESGEGTQVQKDRNRDNLRGVVQYCMNTTDCRRTQILQYFGENFDKSLCNGTCDNCLKGDVSPKKDVTELAKEAIGLVKAIAEDDKVTLLHCVDVFRGSKIRKIIDKGHDRVVHYGAGASMERGDVERLFQHLCLVQALRERSETNKLGYTSAYIEAGPKANLVLNDKVAIEMSLSKAVGGKKPSKAAVKKPTKAAARAQQDAEEVIEGFSDEDFDLDDEEEEKISEIWPPNRTNRAKPPAANSLTEADESMDMQEQCYKELLDCRRKIGQKLRKSDIASIIPDHVLQELALILPTSQPAFWKLDCLTEIDQDVLAGIDAEMCELLGVCQRFAKKAIASSQEPKKSPVASTSRTNSKPGDLMKSFAYSHSRNTSNTSSTSTKKRASKGGIAAMPMPRRK